ncbi:hypothetical protein [Streptococcus porcinus]|uniref:Chromosome assembly-related protein n=2 Tax=Streptococcus porcinus TaxID=1340 RepID=A0A4V0H0I0_STRPO|nr:hypothetical protein [Streptococcus porcinus]EGJ28188.1 hypothetical protein STRPO_1610 [Streptococcus porcinus str. Jelinkova 176]SQG42595.1 Chromosome assembly-related protein [Streptococcus porcinus]VTT41625.1 Chromosome assembly-related protein [Streptococcus porcinus]VTT42658.1 Chromosome assembly-related protein [Streptococcus porcinus]
MINLKQFKSLSVITLLSLTAFAGTYQTKSYADDTTHSTSLKVNMTNVEKKLADADKEAEPIYAKMDKIQKIIDNIRTAKLSSDELSLTKKISQLNEKHQVVLEKFYNQLGDKRWHSEKEALGLVAKSKLSKTEKNKLTSYFKNYYKHQHDLDKKYDNFNKLTSSQQNKLESLTKKADTIYKKHGITKDILMAYYAQKGMKAD